MKLKYLLLALALVLPATGSVRALGPTTNPTAEPDAYPWQLQDLSGTINRTLMSNIAWGRLETLEASKTGTAFTWDTGLPGVMTVVARDPQRGLYMQTFYKNRATGKTFNFFDYNMDAFPATDVPSMNGFLFELRGHGPRKSIYSRETGKLVRSYYGTGFCGSFDPFWLYVGDTRYIHYDLSFIMEDVGGNKRILKDQSGHIPYTIEGSTIYGDPICGKGTTVHDANKFYINRLSQNIPVPTFYFPVDAQHGACDTTKKHCGKFNFTQYTTGRFGKANTAIQFKPSKISSFFELPETLLTALEDKQKFSIGFWARVDAPNVAPNVVSQTEKFSSVFYGLANSYMKDPNLVAGLSVSNKTQQLTLNRASFVSPKSTCMSKPKPKKCPTPQHLLELTSDPTIMDWKFWLPPEFNVSRPAGVTGKRWIYILLSYNRSRTAVYTHDPKNMSGDFKPRYTKKTFILMNNDVMSKMDKWGFGNPGGFTNMDKIDAIDDITVFLAPLEAHETYVRSALNEAVLGEVPKQK